MDSATSEYVEKNSLGKWFQNLHIQEDFQDILEKFSSSDFKKLSQQEQFYFLCKEIYNFIESHCAPCFLLPKLTRLITAINKNHVLESPFRFANFEMWLNVFSGLSEEKNIEIRAKIMGQHAPREEYQRYFPLQDSSRHSGTHIVTAHSSPDLDTAVASFWGWVDAFTAQVSTCLHLWNLPGGRLNHQDRLLFDVLFGDHCFDNLAKARTSLTLVASDLVNTKSFKKITPDTKISQVAHDDYKNALLVVDPQGYYLGDWRRSDVEGVRMILTLLNNCLRWVENRFHGLLIAFFAQDKPLKDTFLAFCKQIQDLKFSQSQPYNEYTPYQQDLLKDYLHEILHVKQHNQSTFYELADALHKQHHLHGFMHFFEKLNSPMTLEQLFDSKGRLHENRPQMFRFIDDIMSSLDQGVEELREYVDSLKVALDIKEKVLKTPFEFVTVKADVDEVRATIEGKQSVTVIYPEKTGKKIPLGVIRASDLKPKSLGTVSLRDFCNREEVKIAPYLEVISVIDHHKCDLKSFSAPVAIISNTQSCNTLVAELQRDIEERYSSDSAQEGYWVSQERQIFENFALLFAILDDTDLLSKVSHRDLSIVASLLNRLKSLQTGQSTRLISFEGIPLDSHFCQTARNKLLQNLELYSIYSLIYERRRQALCEQMENCSQGQEHELFGDTKLQNGCSRVGQTKIIADCWQEFETKQEAIRNRWLRESKNFYHNSRDVDLFCHMLSTIQGAQNLFDGGHEPYKHEDQLWIWNPSFERAFEHLTHFLRGFRLSPAIQAALEKNQLHVSIEGSDLDYIKSLVDINFCHGKTPLKIKKAAFPHEGACITIYYPAGSINSRKAAVSPYLPARID